MELQKQTGSCSSDDYLGGKLYTSISEVTESWENLWQLLPAALTRCTLLVRVVCTSRASLEESDWNTTTVWGFLLPSLASMHAHGLQSVLCYILTRERQI